MKLSRYIFTMAMAAGVLSACQELDKTTALAPSDVVPPVLHEIPSAIEVTSANMGTTVDFSWDAADFGVNTQISYAIETAWQGDTITIASGISSTSSSQTYEVINAALSLEKESGGLGLPVGSPTQVHFLVSATIGTSFPTYYSEGIPSTVTVTAAERTYPMVYVIGDYNGWADDTMQKLFSFSGDEVTYTGVIDFAGKAANGFKIKGTATGWDDNCNWGTDGDAAAPDAEAATIQLISSGGSGNIFAYSHRFYRFSFNRSSLVLTNELSFDQIGVIGDFNSWGSDVVLNFDSQRQVFWADVEFPAEGGFKIRKDGAWDTSWGTATSGAAATSGVFDGGNNITAPAGNYRIYVNFNNPDEMTWELNAADYGTGGDVPGPEPEPTPSTWKVHGQIGSADWADHEMESVGNNDFPAWKLAGASISAGSQFGFKDPDGQWYAVEGGFAEGANPYIVVPDAAMTVSSSNTVNAQVDQEGTYDIWILPGAGSAYVMTAGANPEYVPDTYGIVGTINGWGVIGDYAMTEENGLLVRRNVSLTTSDSFKIRYGNEWNDAANYGTLSGGAVDINSAVEVTSGGGSQNISVQLDGVYDIWLDITGMKICIASAGQAPVL